jgi:hypothetical protein
MDFPSRADSRVQITSGPPFISYELVFCQCQMYSISVFTRNSRKSLDIKEHFPVELGFPIQRIDTCLSLEKTVTFSLVFFVLISYPLFIQQLYYFLTDLWSDYLWGISLCKHFHLPQVKHQEGNPNISTRICELVWQE